MTGGQCCGDEHTLPPDHGAVLSPSEPSVFCGSGMALPPRLTEQLSCRYTQCNHPFPSLWRKETGVLARKSEKSSNLLEGRTQVAVAGQQTLTGFTRPWARPDSLGHLS